MDIFQSEPQTIEDMFRGSRQKVILGDKSGIPYGQIRSCEEEALHSLCWACNQGFREVMITNASPALSRHGFESWCQLKIRPCRRAVAR
ncbi:hypothetical protein TNCV_5015211 [Trichonephila clavipes]|nr:hypothetical protein TNCV_5015211 [Trichonephila clavipes]